MALCPHGYATPLRCPYCEGDCPMPLRPIPCDCAACATPSGCPLRETCRRAAGHPPDCHRIVATAYPGGPDCHGYWPEED